MSRSFTDWVFSTPWWLPAIIVAVGVALWFSGNRRTDKTLKRVGLGVLLVGVALAMVSYFVETKVERVTRRSRELVKSIVDRDWKKTESFLDPKAGFKAETALFSLPLLRNRDEILATAKQRVDQVNVTAATVTHIEVQDNGPLLTASLTVFSTQERAGGLNRTDWQLAWEKTGDDWVVTDITFIRAGMPEQGGK
jgi:hypothetical protein